MAERLAWAVVVFSAQATWLTIGLLVAAVLISGDTMRTLDRAEENYRSAIRIYSRRR